MNPADAASGRHRHRQFRGGGCPNCGAGLDLHQPDAGLPGRLLATCAACKSWYVAEGDAAVEVRMPNTGPDP